MTFDPKPIKYPFPNFTDQHYLVVKRKFNYIFDDSYPYIDESKSFKRKRLLINILLRTIVFPFSRFKIGLRIRGKIVLKQNKKLLDEGAISIANHIHLWDYIAVMKALKNKTINVLAWDKNINGSSGGLIRLVGGIPIPKNSYVGTISFKNSVERLLNHGGWLHIYPEGSMWEYYQPIRPFKHGAFYFAKKLNKPIVPMAFSYRRPGFIRKYFFKQPAVITLTIGQPIYVDKNLDNNEQEIDLLKRSHMAICSLAGIDPKDNVYQPLFQHSKRIDYYSMPKSIKKC